jgi:putative phosphoribosyl transferase
MFRDRVEAGRRLAEMLHPYGDRRPVVLAIPRGGVVVAHEVAQALGAPMDIIVPRKIGAPGNPELAIGAVAEDGTRILDDRLIRHMDVPEGYLVDESRRQIEEIERRMRRYRGDEPSIPLEGRVVIIIDDGVATGATIRAAIHSVRRRRPASIVVATPVGPMETVGKLREDADDVVCLSTPEPFYAIGHFYRDFSQVSDEEVVRILRSRER